MNQNRVFDMEEQKAKWVFDQGGFSKALVVPPRWVPATTSTSSSLGRERKTSVLERQRGGWRVFKTIDAAVSTANGIGFRRIEVDLTSL
ncbi:plasmid replication protein RepB [Klebsiella michiganensis]|uniref:plasmid replication protein RepB n=1 Tax=Klebsiella michiganensis TaxID=1134687 RepID=UPI001E62894E|nr:plasmid replication protein RepB [Klebsiella michiganensis]